MKLFLKISNLCNHNTSTLRTDRQTDRQTTCDRHTALCTKVHRAVKMMSTHKSWICRCNISEIQQLLCLLVTKNFKTW